MVDAVASLDDAGKTWGIALVNRHRSESVTCTLKMNDTLPDGTCKATLVTGDSPESFNDIAHPDRGARRKIKLTFCNGATTLPPHSLTIVELAGSEL